MGAEQECDYNSRMFYYATVVEQALRFKVPFDAWDDGGDWQIYLRTERKWNDIKDILIHFNPTSPTNLTLQNVGNALSLSWENRANYTDSILIDRKISKTDTFVNVCSLSDTATVYSDKNISNGVTYYYRIRTMSHDTLLYSYPISIEAVVASDPEHILSNDINLYPNPANDYIFINNNNSFPYTLDVFTLGGVEIQHYNLKGSTNGISLLNFANGMYLFKLESSFSIITEKVFIMH